jgi:regulator of sirC expression with transglutaminase-like and TPR domain
MTTEFNPVVKALLETADEKATKTEKKLRDGFTRLKQIDALSSLICAELTFSELEPDERISRAVRLVELQNERKEIVEDILPIQKLMMGN